MANSDKPLVLIVDDKPENCLFIDDHEPNVTGAHQLGIPAVHFQYHGFRPPWQS